MAVDVQPTAVQGYCDNRFAEVADEFRNNFDERGELGASVAMIVGGQVVVDLWGGYADADRRTPWQQDTICTVFSCTKGAVSLCAHMLAIEGELDFDATVATYWPEFAAAGKQDVLVRHLLTHQAGLPAVRNPLKPGAFLDWEHMVDVLAAEEPFWQPGSAHGYHGLTFGFLVGEVIRRVTGQTVGEFLRREVAEPLDIDFHLGLPASEHGRVSHVAAAPPPAPGDPVTPYLIKAMTDPTSMQALMLANNGGWLLPEQWDSPESLSAEVPAAGGVGNARSLAQLYSAIVHERRVGRVSFSYEDIVRMGAVQSAETSDVMLFAPGRWTLGFMKAATSPRGVEPPVRVVLSEDAFGHTGHGGSIGFADPVADLSFAYVMNRMDPDLGLSAKGQSLVDAAYRALGYSSTHGERWVRDPREGGR
jgi:CubicO group peptidase (beta-lactamase class C family)